MASVLTMDFLLCQMIERASALDREAWMLSFLFSSPSYSQSSPLSVPSHLPLLSSVPPLVFTSLPPAAAPPLVRLNLLFLQPQQACLPSVTSVPPPPVSIGGPKPESGAEASAMKPGHQRLQLKLFRQFEFSELLQPKKKKNRGAQCIPFLYFCTFKC